MVASCPVPPSARRSAVAARAFDGRHDDLVDGVEGRLGQRPAGGVEAGGDEDLGGEPFVPDPVVPFPGQPPAVQHLGGVAGAGEEHGGPPAADERRGGVALGEFVGRAGAGGPHVGQGRRGHAPQDQVEGGRAGPVAAQVERGDAGVEPQRLVRHPGGGLRLVRGAGGGQQQVPPGRGVGGEVPQRLDGHRDGVLVVAGDAAGGATGTRRHGRVEPVVVERVRREVGRVGVDAGLVGHGSRVLLQLHEGMAASRRRVYSCCGWSSTVRASPCSTTRPPLITAIRSHRSLASIRSWVTKSRPMPSSSTRVTEQVDDLGLGGDVQGGGALVGDDQRGAGDDGEPDRDPLPQATGELVGIAGQHPGRIGDPHLRQHLDRAPLDLGPGDAPDVAAQHLGELGADLQQRVQRPRRVLEDHADGAAADPVGPVDAGGHHLLTGERDGALVDPDVAVEQTRRRRGPGWSCRCRTHRRRRRSGRGGSPGRRRRAAAGRRRRAGR